MSREQHSVAFLAKNPNHAVPVLEFTDGHGKHCCMFESTGIVAFLADSVAPPSAGLVPSVGSVRERADFSKWMWFCGNWMDSLLWNIRQHGEGP